MVLKVSHIRGEAENEFEKVPRVFWCDNWYFPGTKDVIPDGHDCCFMHYRGLPTRNGKRHPLYNYQVEILKQLSLHDLMCIIKSPKLGITELFLCWAIWKACVDPIWFRGKRQVMIIVATGMQNTAIMINRLKDIAKNPHHPLPIDEHRSDSKYEFTLNDVEFYAFPANNIDSARSKTEPALMLFDESAMFIHADDSVVKAAGEHYHGSIEDYKLVMVSTAGAEASGMMYDIVKGRDKRYKVIELTNPDKYGLPPHPDSGTSMYIKKTIDEDRKHPEFRRNYLGEWGYSKGGIFDAAELEKITVKYRIPTIRSCPGQTALAIDPAYGRGESKSGARFGMVGAFVQDGKIYVESVSDKESVGQKAAREMVMTQMNRGYDVLLIDAAEAGLCDDMDDLGYNVRRMNFGVLQRPANMQYLVDTEDLSYLEGMRMIDQLERLISQERIQVHPKFNSPLLEQLRGITKNDRGLPDKKKLRFDVGDCLQMIAYELKAYL